MSEWHCYLLQETGGKGTYIGATVAPDRRVRQHNGEIVGGAQRTKGRAWRRAVLVSGFPDSTAALQFEWAWKFRSRKFGSGIKNRIKGLWNLVSSPQSTSKAVPFSEWTTKLNIRGEEDCLAEFEEMEEWKQILSFLDTISQGSTIEIMNN